MTDFFRKQPLSRNSHMAVIGAALIALCAALALTSPALASSDTPHPALAACKQAWNDSSAKDTCHTETFDTEPGNCVVSASCKRANTYERDDDVATNCARVLVPGSQILGPPEYEHWCTSTVKFPVTTTDVVNCDGTLKAPSC